MGEEGKEENRKRGMTEKKCFCACVCVCICIVSKVLAKRMKEVLNEIINYDQVGYIKHINIGEAVRLIDDMLFYSMHYGEQGKGFLCAVDFEKAFDSVSHRYLFQILKLFGFGDSFCSWVKLLYKGISSCVMNGGHSIASCRCPRAVGVSKF